MTDDAFPKVTTIEIDNDEAIELLEGSAGLFSPAFGTAGLDAAHCVAVLAAAIEAEEEFPGFIHDDISVEAAHMCALAEDVLFHCQVEPHPDYIARLERGEDMRDWQPPTA